MRQLLASAAQGVDSLWPLSLSTNFALGHLDSSPSGGSIVVGRFQASERAAERKLAPASFGLLSGQAEPAGDLVCQAERVGQIARQHNLAQFKWAHFRLGLRNKPEESSELQLIRPLRHNHSNLESWPHKFCCEQFGAK